MTISNLLIHIRANFFNVWCCSAHYFFRISYIENVNFEQQRLRYVRPSIKRFSSFLQHSLLSEINNYVKLTKASNYWNIHLFYSPCNYCWKEYPSEKCTKKRRQSTTNRDQTDFRFSFKSEHDFVELKRRQTQ